MTAQGEAGPGGAQQKPEREPATEPRRDRAGARGDGGGGGAVHIGNMSGGAIASGAHGQATSYSYAAPPPQPDEATLALLEAVRALRADLRARAHDNEIASVDGELAAVEGEITSTGRAGPGRLAGLRDRLEASASVVGLLASATAVVQAAAQVLG